MYIECSGCTRGALYLSCMFGLPFPGAGACCGGAICIYVSAAPKSTDWFKTICSETGYGLPVAVE